MANNDLQNWIIFCDTDILVINKPAGVLSVPDGYHSEYPHLRSILEPEYGRLYIVHRLDKDSSGVMVLARTREAHRLLNMQFDQRTTQKKYQALILGSPPWKSIIVDSPLTVNGDRSHRTRTFPNKGKPASTEFRVDSQWQFASLITAIPHTGYTHQIRAHLSSIGFPLLSDRLYTSPDLQNKAESFNKFLGIDQNDIRPMLHAGSLCFRHPVTEIEVQYSSTLPADFIHIISRLNEKRSEG